MSKLYGIWHRQIHQLAVDHCASRLTNMTWLIVGIYLAGSVHLSKVARKLPIRAKKLSLDKRLRRFLGNGAVRVREWYYPTATQLLKAASSAGKVHLIIDASKVGSGHRLLMVSLAYQRRSLPIAWTWVRSSRGHSTTAKQIALLSYVNQLLPSGVRASLVGDCEFEHTLLIEYLDFWGWDYALRQSKDNLVMPKGTGQWQRLDSFAIPCGTLMWLGNVVLTRASAYPTQVVLYWQKGEKDPWYLATNQPEPRAAIRLYQRRMWIEEMFGDLKKHGFDLESTALRHFLRLSRLTLAVCWLYVWLVTLGEHVWSHHLSEEVDRRDRRDLSIFRLGWDWLERRLALRDTFPLCFIPNFCSLSGG